MMTKKLEIKMSENFLKVADINELQEGRGIQKVVNNREIGLFCENGQVFAIDGECPHVGGPLGEGFVEEGKVYCPLHGWPFDLKTGKCLTNSRAKVECFSTKVKDGEVFVCLSE
jgi:nitrite reductase/ring-hydroxylating ferredoxin subunit